jgi:hypothetical protein
MRGCLHAIRNNFEIPIGEVPFARDRFPSTAFHPAIVVAAVFSGKLAGTVLNRLCGVSIVVNRQMQCA